jgi:hypothetical protein
MRSEWASLVVKAVYDVEELANLERLLPLRRCKGL